MADRRGRARRRAIHCPHALRRGEKSRLKARSSADDTAAIVPVGRLLLGGARGAESIGVDLVRGEHAGARPALNVAAQLTGPPAKPRHASGQDTLGGRSVLLVDGGGGRSWGRSWGRRRRFAAGGAFTRPAGLPAGDSNGAHRSVECVGKWGEEKNQAPRSLATGTGLPVRERGRSPGRSASRQSSWSHPETAP